MKSLKNHELDFYAEYTKNPEAAEKRKKLFLMSMPAAIVIVALGAIIGNLAMENLSIQGKLSEQQLIMEDTDIIDNYNRSVLYSGYSHHLSGQTNGIDSFSDIYETYPEFGSKELNAVLGCATEGIAVTGISLEPNTGLSSFMIETGNVSAIPGFINRLMDTGLFEKVDYTGYSGELVNGVYRYSLKVTVVQKKPVIAKDTEETAGEE